MPEQIRGSYQYFTQSDIERLTRAGYNGGFTPLEEAVDLYVEGLPRSCRSVSLTGNG